MATGANLGGLGAGALVSGVIAQVFPGPLTTTYAVFTGLLCLCLVALAVVPETVPTSRGWRYRPQTVIVPAGARARYAVVAAAAAFVAFALFGLFTSLGPKILTDALGVSSLASTGALAAAVFVCAVLGQLATGSWAAPRQVTVGLGLLFVGLALIVLAGVTGTALWFAAGGTIGGAGAGITFKGATQTAGALADPAHRGESLAGIFLTAYVGIFVPVVGLGATAQAIALEAAVATFAGVLLACLVAIGVAARRTLR